jgi:hypothetical protein
MDKSVSRASGIEQLVERWRIEFRHPENTDFYSEVDYKEAERKFVKFCLNGQFDELSIF